MSSEDKNTSPSSSSSASPPPPSSIPPPPSSSIPPPPASHFIGRREDLIQAGRVTKVVNGCRDVLILHHQGLFHAMDVHCYHSGGLLQNGDIEDFNGRTCIVCPWHKYKITLEEGEGLYQSVDPSVRPPKPSWRSKGVKQRVHKVTEVSGDVYVTLNDWQEVIESDVYQTERYRESFRKSRPERRT